MSTAIRIVLAEDHEVVREGLRALLAVEPDFEVVGEATDGFEAVRLVGALAPKVLLVDLSLPGLNGVDVIRRVREQGGDTAIVVLSMHDDAPTVERALGAGATGYVVKGAGSNVVKEAIRAVATGQPFLSTEVASYHLEVAPGRDGPVLTPRQLEILKLVAEGHTGRVIAGLLNISPKTVENHRAHIMEKLGLHTTAALVRYAIKAGLAG